MEIPESLRWTERLPAGRAWRALLPDRLAECVAHWDLRVVGPPFGYAFASLAVPVELTDGTPAVLKLQYPDDDSRDEAAALAHWAGRGAIRLLAHDPQRRALLVERCLPGTPLHELPLDAALDVVVELLPRLGVPAGPPFTPLAEEAASWAEQIPANWERANRPYERRLLDTALGLLADLAPSQGGQVLVNQDLHAGNVLRATRDPWLAIDPKPLVGEREFAPVPMVRGPELGHSPEAVRHRLDRLSAELGLDRERVRGWTIVHTTAWSIGGDQVFPNQVEVVRWLLGEE
ncbi:aminoglycoside phosphotransferase family protein [Micromonospora sp. DR5-3]|uniref:aminoglycoside phosphotransferase family protein n=1 Tax=unclassified Micromonospora TaxID=2617518 RepID=UPI0011D95CD7|nr:MULTISPECIES: aminoglycoside phosphotransferase family protein [unclassified Micromonospora]MCW3814810.1 aminoglycoside phosphotransferase family protein [Micromonospora sp. DR5-3]TYC24134.1 aminoglycoside phosphotransferase [Micromonospora sp. MP36]